MITIDLTEKIAKNGPKISLKNPKSVSEEKRSERKCFPEVTDGLQKSFLSNFFRLAHPTKHQIDATGHFLFLNLNVSWFLFFTVKRQLVCEISVPLPNKGRDIEIVVPTN